VRKKRNLKLAALARARFRARSVRFGNARAAQQIVERWRRWRVSLEAFENNDRRYRNPALTR